MAPGPLIFGAGVVGALTLWERGEFMLTQAALLAALIAFLAALGAIHFLMELARRTTFAVFVVYRITLGCLIYAILIFDWLPLPPSG